MKRIFKVGQKIVKSPQLLNRSQFLFPIDWFDWFPTGRHTSWLLCSAERVVVPWVGGRLGEIQHPSVTIAAPRLQRHAAGSFFHVNTCSLGTGPRLPKSSQMAQILYRCQSALEFNNNLEVKLGPFLVANPQSHLSCPFLWFAVQYICVGAGRGWGRKPGANWSYISWRTAHLLQSW